MPRLVVSVSVVILLSAFFVARSCKPEPTQMQAGPMVFDLPTLQVRFLREHAAMQSLFNAGNYLEAERACAQLIALVPHDPVGHFNLACALNRQGKDDRALQSLSKAVELGFNDVEKLQRDADLASLRGDDRFTELLARATVAEPQPDPWQRQVEPSLVDNGQALVTRHNTAWDGRLGVFRTAFRFPAANATPGDASLPDETADLVRSVKPIIEGHGEIGRLLRQWYSAGTAAGNTGDLYDNHDVDHSNMDYGQFPQLTRIEFSKAAKKRQLHNGLQNRFFYNHITLGNSSTALTGGPYWRSQPRLAYTDARTAALLSAQYVNSHIYVYPEHRDHDPDDSGFGDVFPANTPYLIISQGSSGSDRVFLGALACTLAAFRPEVKRKLAESGTLMSTLQMIFRSCNKSVVTPDDYLTGKAHPTVFAGEQIDALKMVKMAHDIRFSALPPMVQLSVVEEDEPVVGRDYFAPAPRQQLFSTPAAIARIHRTTKYNYRMVVSAERSRDLLGRNLTWHWKVLRGDAKATKIRLLNEAGSVAELVVPYQPRQAIEPNSAIHSNRVDIGVFVHNGRHYSAPGFISFFTLNNERRVYNDKNQIQSVAYFDSSTGGNYSDPLVALPKAWRDEYEYGEAGELIGWTRHRGRAKEDFTAKGELITKRDDQGLAIEIRDVKYIAAPRPNQVPILKQVVANE